MARAKYIEWTEALLGKPTAEIQRTLARRKPPVVVSKAAICHARKVRGIATPQGHGGTRAGAGRKRED